MDSKLSLHYELRKSVLVLSSVGLMNSAKWSAEALNGLEPLNPSQQLQLEKHCAGSIGLPMDYKFMLAKTYFDCKEFDRVANMLKESTDARSVFLRLYALFLSGERKLHEDFGEILGEKSTKEENCNTGVILKEATAFLAKAGDAHAQSDYSAEETQCYTGLVYYVLGIIYLKQKGFALAQENFFQSIRLFPYNWECWNDLLASCSNFEEGLKVLQATQSCGSDLMSQIFAIAMYQEFYQQNKVLYDQLEKLMVQMPKFLFLKIQKALISYQSLNYPMAEAMFDEILVEDPYNLDHMDTYSNILYVMENKSKLSFLAQFANSIDKFRPETCCIIANYYSLQYEHEKAIMYYKRALNLNKNCLSAWTLMGHEFVELKNSHAAIESYRRAVDTNQKDFRAWYGLGQAYEILDMHLYSLYYYQKSCELNPLDKRMWTAVGNCYEKLGKTQESIKTYLKILTIHVSDDDVTFVLYKLGKLYEAEGDLENAEKYMKKCFDEETESGVVTTESNRARLWLSKKELHDGNWEKAYEYASEFNHGTIQEIEEARSIVRDCRNRIKNTT